MNQPADMPANAADAQALPWVPDLDPIAPLPVMDWRLDFLAAEPMGPDAATPLGQCGGLLPLAGGVVVGAGGLRGQVAPGPVALPLLRPDGVQRLRLTLRLLLDDGNSVIAELDALGEGPAQRAVLRCTVNRGRHDWLNACTLMATAHEERLPRADARGVARRLHLRVHSMEGGLPDAGTGRVLPGYVPLSDQPPMPVLRTAHVLNIVASCSAPEPAGLSPHAPDGVRSELWPITGGRFASHDGQLQGDVVAGGADFPHIRPDGVEWVEALYRLRGNDGSQIVIHNKGIYREGACRLHPEFIAARGPHDWLNQSIFVGTLVFPVPLAVSQARSADENDRLIQVHRLL